MSNSKQTSLFERVIESTIGVVVATVISLFLVSGSSYLLFDTSDELNRMRQANAQTERELKEIRLGTEMLKIVEGGLSESDAARLGTTMGLLENLIAVPSLGSEFTESTTAWCYVTLETLTAEREQIKGFVFTNKIIVQTQNAYLKVYDAYIKLFQEILKLTQSWEIMTLTQRQAQLSKVKLGWIDVGAAASALDSMVRQVGADIETANAESTLQIRQLEDDYRAFQKRFWFSILGVLAGVALLIATVVYTRKAPVATPPKTHQLAPAKPHSKKGKKKKGIVNK